MKINIDNNIKLTKSLKDENEILKLKIEKCLKLKNKSQLDVKHIKIKLHESNKLKLEKMKEFKILKNENHEFHQLKNKEISSKSSKNHISLRKEVDNDNDEVEVAELLSSLKRIES